MTLKSNKIATALFWLLGIAFLSGCRVYSFTGTSLPPEVKTMSVNMFPNNSGQGPSYLSQSVTTTFRDYFQRNTNLNLIQQGGDLQFEGQIIGYEVTPVAPTVQDGLDVAARNRLTIRLQVRFINTKDEKQNFDQAFAQSLDFPQNVNINQIPEASITEIINRILPEIFNKSVANW